MEKVIYKTKIKNPNENFKKAAFGLVLLGAIIMILSPLIGMSGWGIFVIPLLFVVASIFLLNRKNATLILFKYGQQDFLLKLEGAKIDYSIRGNFSYEIWRKLIHSRRLDSVHKVPQISVRNGKDPEILIQATNYNPKNSEQWGGIKEGSFNEIGMLLELELTEMEKLIEVFQKNDIKEDKA